MKKSKKKILDKSIVCSNMDSFHKVIKKLHSLGYEKMGLPLYNVWIHEVEWKNGMRVINIYIDKSVKFAANDKVLNKVINDIDFL